MSNEDNDPETDGREGAYGEPWVLQHGFVYDRDGDLLFAEYEIDQIGEAIEDNYGQEDGIERIIQCMNALADLDPSCLEDVLRTSLSMVEVLREAAAAHCSCDAQQLCDLHRSARDGAKTLKDLGIIIDERKVRT